MNINRFIPAILLIAVCSCDGANRTGDDIRKFLREPPIDPVVKTLRMSVPIGYCASLTSASLKGFDIPHTTIYRDQDKSFIYLESFSELPVPYCSDYTGEIIIASLKVSEDLFIMSIFFTEDTYKIGNFSIMNVETIPVILEDERLTTIYANNDINIQGDPSLDIELGPMEVEIEISRLDFERPETEKVAIRQNAWIIDVFTKGTPASLVDDDYMITGGEQNVAVGYQYTTSSTSVLQMAMIEAKIYSGCFRNPGSGFVVLREIGVETGSCDNLEDLVLGTVFFDFHERCDGKVKIPLATGNFVTATGKEYDLGLY